ncbi:MAG TPA: cytochrome c peroxidase [Pirellulales bacterium]|jgi:cytochrome c peroxidase|nr:cytochrome c peroxidase [Pirellulales bacterium]
MKIAFASLSLVLGCGLLAGWAHGETPLKSTAAPAASAATQKVLLGKGELTRGIPGDGPLTQAQLRTWLDNPHNHEALEIELPLGLAAGVSQVKGLKENPLTRAKIELGRQLYFDKRLSADGTVSCATCHDPGNGWAKHTQFGVGIRAQQGGRNSPVAFNRILSDKQFWDGRAASLEEQAIGPIQNPIEMGNNHPACVKCLAGIEGYRLEFAKVFGGAITIERVGQALASFERTIVTGPSPYDYEEVVRPFARLDPDDIKDDPALSKKYQQALADAKAHPMSESAKRGRDLFFSAKANCTACHVGANFTDEQYHNLGVGMKADKPDLGRAAISKNPKDTGAFKTPTIRNVALTAPYMHDGSQKTLAEVVEYYSKGGEPNPHLDEKVKKLDLTAQDKSDLVEFMKACTGEFNPANPGRLPE